MQFYELILIEKAANRVLAQVPPARQPWGSFARGELVRHEGRYFPIDQVISQFATREAGTLFTTTLLLGPMLPDFTLSDVTVPEPGPLPVVAPAPSEGSRRWWGR